MPSFKVEAQVFTILAVIYVVDIVLGKIEPESPIELGHTTHYPKNVQGTLIKTYFKISQKIGDEFTHKDPNPSLYNCNQRNDNHFYSSPKVYLFV